MLHWSKCGTFLSSHLEWICGTLLNPPSKTLCLLDSSKWKSYKCCRYFKCSFFCEIHLMHFQRSFLLFLIEWECFKCFFFFFIWVNTFLLAGDLLLLLRLKTLFWPNPGNPLGQHQSNPLPLLWLYPKNSEVRGLSISLTPLHPPRTHTTIISIIR